MEAEGAPIQTYALERLVKDATESMLVNEVYKDYCDWCAEQNIEEPFKPGHFGTALKAAVPTIAHSAIRVETESIATTASAARPKRN